jgi:hypothetical protein
MNAQERRQVEVRHSIQKTAAVRARASLFNASLVELADQRRITVEQTPLLV